MIQITLTKASLTEREQLEGSILSEPQLLVLSNEKSVIAERILNLTFDPHNPVQFGLDQAFLNGQLVCITWLIDGSMAAKAALLELAKKQSAQGNNPDQFN
jgi:hypothetical protein